MYEDSFDSSAFDVNSAVDVTYGGVAGGSIMLLMASMWLFVLVFYVYSSICWLYIAKRTKTENGWFAFLPILSTILMLQIAKRPLWWVLLFFVPIVNIVIAILVLVDVMKTLRRPTWWVIMQFVPVANLVFLGLMAWGQDDNSVPAPRVIPPAPVQ